MVVYKKNIIICLSILNNLLSSFNDCKVIVLQYTGLNNAS